MMLKVNKILPNFVEKKGFEFIEITKLKMIYIFLPLFEYSIRCKDSGNKWLNAKQRERKKGRTNTPHRRCTLLKIHIRTQILSHDSHT